MTEQATSCDASPLQWQAVAPISISSAAIEKIAESIAKKINYQPAGDLKSAVQTMGGTIRYTTIEELNDDVAEFHGDDIRIKGFRNFEIRLSPFTGELRDRFSIAHELGHYVLHFLYPNQIENKKLSNLRAFRSGGDEAEKEANLFASYFLMPKEFFTKSYRESDGVISKVATLCNVSHRIAYYRAKGLGLLPEVSSLG